MSAWKYILPGLGLVLVGAAVASARGAVPSGDGPNSPLVPVPFKPRGSTDAIGYRYRGVYIGISSANWAVFATPDFSVAPIAFGGALNEDAALSDAMKWTDAFRSKG